ncbi:MAG: DUF362 domain-containing protein [Deltaproteobacteria bacterium]|nr:DUF362 domain-containing protein [Deltaproteobacteria bacterium]
MTSKVYFHDASASSKKNRLDKVKSLFNRARLGQIFDKGDKVAIKIHWGEPGNVGFLPPPYVRTVVEMVKENGGIPFVTDTNTLYTGMRRNAIDNIAAAASNGFTAQTLGAPIIVADGLVGRDTSNVSLENSTVKEAKIASAIVDADAMLVLSHIKGHMLFGFGGALKNLGMGCATPAGKQILHSDIQPEVKPDLCQGDALCIPRCPVKCISLVAGPGQTRVAKIDSAECIGCGECTATCPHQAIPINWTTTPAAIQHKTADYALAAVKNKLAKVGYLNFIIQVTPDCDCCDWNDVAFVPDVGFTASTDAVAIDTASVDLVAKTPPSPNGRAAGCQGDPWRAIYDIDYRIILDYAEKIGLGSRQYELIEL